MKNLFLALALSAAALGSLNAQAGVYTLKCATSDGSIRVELGDLLVVNQSIEVDQSLVKVTLPMALETGDIVLKRDFFRATDFEVRGNNDVEFITLRVKDNRYELETHRARGEDVSRITKGRIDCRVYDPNDKRVR